MLILSRMAQRPSTGRAVPSLSMVTREKVKNSPEYDPSNTLARSYEEDLYHHYGYFPLLERAGWSDGGSSMHAAGA